MSAKSSPAAVAAVVFDAYGTLFDVYSVTDRCEALFPGKGEALSRLWRAKQLEYSWLTSLMRRYRDFETLTGEALSYACEHLGLTLDQQGAQALMGAYDRLAPYREVPAALEALAGLPLAILSNGSPRMLASVVESSGLAARFAAVLSVDEVRAYKPDPRVYQVAVDRLGVAREVIAFVSSNGWDAAGAAAFGFRVFWVNRAGLPRERLDAPPEAMLGDLSDLPPRLARGDMAR